jgi:plasmid replication initiation protein
MSIKDLIAFETWILKKPLEEINAHTSFNVSYEKVKKGRSIDSIVFHIEKKLQDLEQPERAKVRGKGASYE